ncbi:protocadherin Fat 4-like isoform X2 [Dreissena polymorpha]|uniref:protocadherin Fat 4-like isoform X2 n=1 Tax=Dreissena polymorpha TaxID=45954 RepID=UPI002263DDC9|nr:protocadherin Fat 4-like isoform X2 [Dreissena polymorpha]
MENMVQLFFLICLVICVAGQVDRFIWVNSMNQFSLDESQPEETKVYTLRATYDGSDNNMEYGFNTKQAADNSLSQESTYFRINKDSGEVFTKGILDYENANIKQNGVQLQLIARLKTDPTQFRKQVSTVIVRNTNDEKPQFVNGSMIVKIEENREILNSGGLRLIPNIKVVDVDNILESGTNKIDATVNNCKVGSNLIQCDRIFTLRLVGNPTSIDAFYDFYVLTKIDFEQYDEFQVQLVATDGKNNGTISVIVDVTDLQDTPPKWIDLPAKSQTQDGTGTNQMRISILARDQDLSTIGGERPIFYALEPGQTVRGIAVDRVFEIQQNNSIYPATITNKVPIDLEDDVLFKNYATKEVRVNWPLRVQACEITSSNPLVIGSTFNECTEYGTTVILIADINDNGPKFDQDQYVYRIYEDAPNGLILDDPRIIITDNDTDIYANYKSVLVNPSLEFNVSGADRNPAITVLNTSLIDYDSGKILYQLTLRTSDVLNPLLFDLAPITIHILDVNDNFPAFGQPNGYKAIIPENSPEGTNVIRITATDRDSGMMGTAGLKYGLTGSYSSLFKIDELTGQVTVAYCDTPGKNPCLDYDILPRLYPLDVIVSDMQGNPNGKQSTVFLEVQVTDVNDNPPTVGNYRRGIFEDKTQFEPPLIVIGTDIDTPSLRYSIQSQAPGTFWRIDPVRGEISVNKNGQGIKFNDGDTSGSFVVFVSVTDGVNPPAQSRVDINVIDINDNAPVFLPDLYEKPIPETTPGGTSILELSATDTDDPTSDNGKLEYSIISGNIGGRFRVNNLGVLFTSNDAKFDYDIQRAYTMVVTVADKGTPQRSDTATVIINILDVNNRDPYVDPFLQNFEVYDNAFLGFKVGTIKAYDPDADAILRFRFNDPKQASSEEGFQVTPDVYDFRYLFRIDENNGDIYVNGSLDSKKTNIVSYGVVVTDVKAVPNQNGPGQAYIRIKPFNTQPPVFEQFQSPIYIDEEQPIGSVIISLIARDNNGIEQYQIIQQPDDFFAANPNTGAVSVVSRVDFDDARRINGSFFIVRVLDTGEPQLSATTSVSVIFRNINDNFPEFINKQTQNPVNVYSAVIDENSPNGTLVVETFAKDSDRPDANGFNVVRYFMFNDDRFDVDSLTGQIFVRLINNAVLDREQNPRILTQVIAVDNPDNNPNNAPGNQRQRVATVQVILRDVNDNPPRFSKSDYYVKIFETIGVQTDILQLFSTDADLLDFATSYYTKIPNAGDDYSDFFDVRRDSGKIYVKRGLVRNVGVYKFYVQAQDNKGTGFRTNASVTVDVQPSANSPPVWVIPPVDNMTIYVLEEQYDGMLIYDVSARDEDTGNNGIVDYSFMYNGVQTQETPDFKINRVTGMISANRTYDRETQPRYVLLLKARDRGETPLETTRFLTVVIKDVNDNRPTFTKSTEQFTVQENTDVGSRFGRVTATDPDQAPVILYKIIGRSLLLWHPSSYTRLLLEMKITILKSMQAQVI